MIVTEEQVEAAHAYLNEQPHPLAIAEWQLMKAKNAREHRHAELYLEVKGTVGEREARIELDNEYGDLRFIEADAFFKVKDEEARVKGAATTIKIWEREKFNAQAVERVR
jgi:hypothetical protein